MQLKKINVVSSMVLALSLFLYSGISAAANNGSSDFVLRLFNNTTQTQPLHYSVKPYGKNPIEGQLIAEDDNGIALKIDSSDKKTEIVVSDYAGHIIWDGKVAFYGQGTEFYTTTVSLAPHYHVGTNAFPSIHAISFDIISEA